MAITPGTDFTEFPIPSADLEDNAADVRAALGLSNVNNTSDANKPVSNATQAALDARVPIGGPLLLVGSGQSNIADASISNVEIAHDKVHFWQAGAWKGAGETVLGAPLYHMAALLADRTGKDVYCVVTGAGGTSISAWIGSGTASAQYVALDDAVTAALATDELTDAGKAAADAFVWVHGEQDASAPTYAADVVTLRGQLDGESWYDQRSAPFLLSRVSGFYDTKSSNGYVIFAQQTQLDFIDPWMIVVDTLGALTTTGDYYANVHFSADGLADIGRRLAGAYVSAPNRNARRYVYDPLDFVNSDFVSDWILPVPLGTGAAANVTSNECRADSGTQLWTSTTGHARCFVQSNVMSATVFGGAQFPVSTPGSVVVTGVFVAAPQAPACGRFIVGAENGTVPIAADAAETLAARSFGWEVKRDQAGGGWKVRLIGHTGSAFIESSWVALNTDAGSTIRTIRLDWDGTGNVSLRASRTGGSIGSRAVSPDAILSISGMGTTALAGRGVQYSSVNAAAGTASSFQAALRKPVWRIEPN